MYAYVVSIMLMKHPVYMYTNTETIYSHIHFIVLFLPYMCVEFAYNILI